MFENSESLIVGGALAVVVYLLVSNTLWLLLGSRVLQSLPGVNIRGFRGTLKIGAMLVLSLLGVFVWMLKWCVALVFFRKEKPVISNEIRKAIRFGAARFVRSDENASLRSTHQK